MVVKEVIEELAFIDVIVLCIMVIVNVKVINQREKILDTDLSTLDWVQVFKATVKNLIKKRTGQRKAM